MSRFTLLAIVVGLANPTGAFAQAIATHSWAANIVVPQSSCYALGGRAATVRIEEVRAEVSIRGQVSTTMLQVKLRNPTSARLEAEVLLPVPESAIVRGFAYEGSASEPTAQLFAKDEARQIYNRIVSQARDPGLLEFVGYNLIRSSVFPVEANGTQLVSLTYEALLGADGDRVDYVLPRSESVQYRVPWRVRVRIESPESIAAVYSPSHMVRTVRPSAKVAEVELESGSATDPGPFRLYYLRSREGVSASLFAYPDARVGGGYFLLLAGLPAEKARKAPAIEREVTLVIDRSGSMRGEKIDQVREAARQVIAALHDGEAFNVILYNEAIDSFSAKPVKKTRETERLAFEFLDGMSARGGTNIHDALLHALEPTPMEGALPIVLFMTDGLPTVGQTSEVAIRELTRKQNPHNRRIFSFGVGVDVNTPLLEKIAYENRGFTTFVLPREDVEVKVSRVFERLTGPVLADARLSIGGELAHRAKELIPERLPDLYQGDQLVLLGQYRGKDPLDFTLTGDQRGVERTFQFRLSLDAANTRNGFVPRLWASRKIGLLVDEVRTLGADGSQSASGRRKAPPTMARELVEEIVRLSTEFGILTEYTAFLALEGTDLSSKESVFANADQTLRSRAIESRTGYLSVNQDINIQELKSRACANPLNKFLCPGDELRESTTATVQQMCDQTFFKRGTRWVDSRLVSAPGAAVPSRVVAFGSNEFRDLADRLSQDGRQGGIALRGDILLMVDGEVVLVTAPAVAAGDRQP
jgi:Ca-activated chloride channel family protein